MLQNRKIYLTVFATLGFFVLAGAFADSRPIDATRFLAYFALAVTASFLKVSMPAIAGNLSFNFFFVLIGILDLTLPQTLMIGATSVLVESLLRQKTRPSLLQGMFGLSNIAVSVFFTDMVYRSAWLAAHGAGSPGWLT